MKNATTLGTFQHGQRVIDEFARLDRRTYAYRVAADGTVTMARNDGKPMDEVEVRSFTIRANGLNAKHEHARVRASR